MYRAIEDVDWKREKLWTLDVFILIPDPSDVTVPKNKYLLPCGFWASRICGLKEFSPRYKV